MTSTDQELLAHARWLRQPISKWPFVLVAVLSSGLCVFAPVIGRGRLLARRNLEQSSRELKNLSAVDLDDRENAAAVWKNAFPLIVAGSGKKDDPLAEETDWSSVDLYLQSSPARLLLAQNDAALQLADQAAAMPRVNWNLDYEAGITVNLSHLKPLRTLVKLVAMRARIAAYDGDWAMVEKSLRTVTCAGAQVGAARPLVCKLLDLTAHRIACHSLEDCLNVPRSPKWRVDRVVLARLQSFVKEQMDRHTDILEGLKFEELSALKMMDLCGSGEVSMTQLSGAPEKTPFLTSYYSIRYLDDRSLFEQSLKPIHADAGNDSLEFEQAFRDTCQTNGQFAKEHGLMLTSLMLPMLGRTPKAERVRRGDWQLASIALQALERRWRDGAFPQSLAQLGWVSGELKNPIDRRYAELQCSVATDGSFWIWCQWSGDPESSGLQPDELKDRNAIMRQRDQDLVFRISPIDLKAPSEK